MRKIFVIVLVLVLVLPLVACAKSAPTTSSTPSPTSTTSSKPATSFAPTTTTPAPVVTTSSPTTTTAKPSQSPTPTNPVKGKTVKLVIWGGPGGTMDTISRMAAPFIEKNMEDLTGADQTVIVESMPGASGRVSFQYIWQNGPDVPEICMVSSSAIQMYWGVTTTYDLPKFTFMGQIINDHSAIAVRKDLPINSWDEFVARSQVKPLLVGTSGFGASEHLSSELVSKILKDKLGIDLKFGYVHLANSNEITPALQRSDIEATISVDRVEKLQIDKGFAKLILIIADKPTLSLTSGTVLPDIKAITPQVSLDLQNVTNFSTWYMGSPNMNPALTELFRESLRRSFKDPALVEKAKAANAFIDYADGAGNLKNVQNAIAALQPYQAFLKDIFK